jgi:D-alanyl-lipoteichoic acid acyltransferase DltB (MBOAT superfamily)
VLGFETIHYFANLMAALVLVAPLFYALRSGRAQKLLLAICGVGLLAAIAPRLALVYLGFWIVVGALQRLLARTQNGRVGRLAFVASIAAALSPMIVWKLFPAAFTESFNVWSHELLWRFGGPLGQIDAVKDIVIPIGLSFAAFRAVDLLVQTRIGLVARERWVDLLHYGLFAPILIVGPVSEYREVSFEEPRRFDRADLIEGLRSMLVGLIKIYVFAFPLCESAEIFSYFDTNPTAVVWLELVLFTWYFYFNFSGFTDLALGCARTLGFRLAGNFDRPFAKPNIRRFWASWHMSLTRFAQRNVFIPAGGHRPRTQYLAVTATMMVIALWHDLSLPMLIFGAYHAAGLCAHRWWETRRRREGADSPAIAHALSVAGTYAFVALSFPMLALPAPLLLPFYASLLGFADVVF